MPVSWDIMGNFGKGEGAAPLACRVCRYVLRMLQFMCVTFLCVCVIMEVQKPSGQIQSCQREWGGGVIFSLYKLSPHKVRWMSPEHHKALKAEGRFITSESSSNAFGIHY